MFDFLRKNNAMARNEGKKNNVTNWTLIMIILALFICLTALVLSALSYNVLHHSAAVALNSAVSSFLSSLNIWMDNGVIKFLKSNSSSSSSGAKSSTHNTSTSKS